MGALGYIFICLHVPVCYYLTYKPLNGFLSVGLLDGVDYPSFRFGDGKRDRSSS